MAVVGVKGLTMCRLHWLSRSYQSTTSQAEMIITLMSIVNQARGVLICCTLLLYQQQCKLCIYAVTLACPLLFSLYYICMEIPSRLQPVFIVHCVPIKTCDYVFYNNFINKCPITIIFGIVSDKSMCHRKTVSFPTSPIQCNYLTLGNHKTQKNDQFRRKQDIVL